jgi:hypothetical protein
MQNIIYLCCTGQQTKYQIPNRSPDSGFDASAQYQERKSTIQPLVFAHYGEDSLQP